ncbi:MAG: acetyl/propionyl-CoA carboxylase, epsilon subunit [Pseudonocardia sp.]|nr:acetyl/propionyl-CoA carboxylase, epsilon subunit [Pseudonocardia sp.]
MNEGQRPHLRVVRGNPTDAELAALTVALAVVQRRRAAAAAADRAASDAPEPVGGWADPSARLRRPLHPGTGAWARSAAPH